MCQQFPAKVQRRAKNQTIIRAHCFDGHFLMYCATAATAIANYLQNHSEQFVEQSAKSTVSTIKTANSLLELKYSPTVSIPSAVL